MSFLSNFFEGGKLSDRSQVHFDLAKIYYDRGKYNNALEEIKQIASSEFSKDKVKELHDLILKEMGGSFPTERDEPEFTVVKVDNDFGSTMILRMTQLDQERLFEKTNEGYQIEAVSFGVEWVFVLRKTEGLENKQDYLILTSFDDSTFDESIVENNFITQAASDGEEWFFVVEEQPDWTAQFWVVSPDEFPKKELSSWESNGYMINLLIEAEGVCFASAVELKNSDNALQLSWQEEPPNEWIGEIWDTNHWIEQLFVTGNNYWFTAVEDTQITDQSLLIDAVFPEKELEIRLNAGHIVKQLCPSESGWIVLTQLNQGEVHSAEEGEEFGDVLKELDTLVGLKEVKDEFYQLVDYLKIGRLKEAHGIQSQQLSLHMVFRGNPGTGKTTVARLLGRVFKSLGLLSKGHIVETDRSALVGQYIGQTAQKTNEKLDEAVGGILFVDEAYALKSEGKSDFGEEALETILKRMEDQRDELVVIFAGYPDEMDELLESNPGLKSRFATHMEFEDFTAEELVTILKKMLVKSTHFMTINAEKYAIKYLNFLSDTADRYFGNAREVRNLFEDLLKSQSSRLAKKITENTNGTEQLSYEELREIHLEDLRKCYAFGYEEYKEESLDDILADLNELIGLNEIKQEIEEMARYIEIMKRRQDSGLSTDIPGMHSVFMGAPGTGKTTVARILARIFKALGVIKKEVLVEASRQDLVAEYVGQTAIKTNKLIDKAMHGVLFIDEAYALTSRGQNDFGQEAIEVLLKRMEDDRDKLVVVVAGYPEPMKNFLESNPGLPSRFNRKYLFPNFNLEELQEIFLFYVQKSSYKLDDDALVPLNEKISKAIKVTDAYFGNARWIRKIFEAAKISQAQRLSTYEFINEEDLQRITKEDLVNAFNRLDR